MSRVETQILRLFLQKRYELEDKIFTKIRKEKWKIKNIVFRTNRSSYYNYYIEKGKYIYKKRVSFLSSVGPEHTNNQKYTNRPEYMLSARN